MSTSTTAPHRPRTRGFRISVALVATGLIVTGAITASPHADAAVPPAPGGMSLVFSDDFNGTVGTLPSSANWQIDTGHNYPGGPANWGTGEVQNYTNSPSNISLDGTGNLRITPLRAGSGWTSARIESHRADFKAPANGILRIEGRIQMPNVTGAEAEGYWPAFWALGAPYRGNYWNWPSIGEFDIMENVNGLNTVWAVLHCGPTEFGGPCNEKNGLGASRTCPGASCQSAFHTYRFEWDRSVSPNQFRWYVDNQQYHTISQNQLPAADWAAMTNHAGYFILLNVAMGGAFPDGVLGRVTPTGATASGRPMVVDYVAVYQSGTSPTSPPTDPPTQPPGATTWAAYTAYTVGQIVTYNGVRYQCRQSHTAYPGWEPPNVLALWLPI
jgi:beta-glucanase (GH16 family)